MSNRDRKKLKNSVLNGINGMKAKQPFNEELMKQTLFGCLTKVAQQELPAGKELDQLKVY